jgi:prepilin-type N-terminal cleavage/methylation domain-containing protein
MKKMGSRAAPVNRKPKAGLGFSLVEMAMVLVILGVMAALFLPATNALIDNGRRKDTRSKLETLEGAITRFVITTGRLPCPADGGLVPGANLYGVEGRIAGLCDSLIPAAQDQSRGVVPWISLGLSIAQATDEWGNLITYRVWAQTKNVPGSNVNTSLVMDKGMDMSACHPAGTAAAVSVALVCDPAQAPATSPLKWLTGNSELLPAQARGFRACQREVCTPSTGATPSQDELTRRVDGNGVAYFLISHGANKFGAYTPSGIFVAQANGLGPSPKELVNRNGLSVRTGSPADFYVDSNFNEDPANYYDDIVLRPTVMKVALDAGLGPRVP